MTEIQWGSRDWGKECKDAEGRVGTKSYGVGDKMGIF